MAGIPGSPPDLREVPPGCAFHPRYPFVIGTCKEVLPVLRSVQGEDADQIVACHLYDPRFHVEPPSMADLARNYEALAEESNAQ
jgi:peptide/nickel transport system ATP-binding protein